VNSVNHFFGTALFEHDSGPNKNIELIQINFLSLQNMPLLSMKTLFRLKILGLRPNPFGKLAVVLYTPRWGNWV